MSALEFPCTIFKTQKQMDDYGASDMHFGDLSETQLKTHFHLTDVSTRVSPYSLTKIAQPSKPMAYSYGYANNINNKNERITRQECAKILFDEFRQLSKPFALYGPYKSLIVKMITHMQNGKGSAFSDISLNTALKEQILGDNSKNSTRPLLKEAINEKIDWVNKSYPPEEKDRLRDAILSGKLPKFDRPQDSFNGMGITIHDTWATHITLKSLQIDNNRYRAVVHYKVQDHFGLDNDDILKLKFKQFLFFRIWFVLQRYNQFGFKPFMTNMEATVEIIGEA
ncbi:hypothetical protein HL670_05373 [Serratia plymuthica]|uniref:YPO3983 family protein n=1 Tax=Serratia plymuthica TaxID=82996 RepID=UPI00034BA362|nr:YPO3983 family protein [Serratia plymuthica]QJW58421.1 hypothetical protein HL670_05373 [Serratia plymuthica]